MTSHACQLPTGHEVARIFSKIHYAALVIHAQNIDPSVVDLAKDPSCTEA
jgi:hypothetical protein